jgi:hypothetical protein
MILPSRNSFMASIGSLTSFTPANQFGPRSAAIKTGATVYG